MTRGRARTPAVPTDAVYDDAYFERDLHREHWFTNNAAKRARRWHELLRMLEPRSSDSILEIGCGAGEHAIPLARFVRKVTGVDMSLAGVRRASARALGEGVRNTAFLAADAAALPFADASFHKVAAIDFVEHVVDSPLAHVLAEAHRVLVAGGTLAIYTPCLTHYVERLKAHGIVLRQIPGHVAVRGPDAYRTLLEGAGFRVRSCRFLPSDYPLFGALDRALVCVPGIAPWFRFRICIVAQKVAA
jgi:cyclopropane fatty-acyl-phospholipid synthase-like methyltransferase